MINSESIGRRRTNLAIWLSAENDVFNAFIYWFSCDALGMSNANFWLPNVNKIVQKKNKSRDSPCTIQHWILWIAWRAVSISYVCVPSLSALFKTRIKYGVILVHLILGFYIFVLVCSFDVFITSQEKINSYSMNKVSLQPQSALFRFELIYKYTERHANKHVNIYIDNGKAPYFMECISFFAA